MYLLLYLIVLSCTYMHHFLPKRSIATLQQLLLFAKEILERKYDVDVKRCAYGF